MTLEKIGPEDALYADLQEIRTASFKAAALTGQLLAFSRKQLITPRVFNLNRLVRETASMIGRLIGEDVELLVSLDPELGNTKADPGQIEQVVMNLAFNARDAMPQGGRLSLETANFEPDGTFLRDHPGIEAGRFVRLVVADTGHGMDSEVLAHLFEPFFTTKQKGRGTGLGLSMAYGIVRQSEGHIFCTSSPGAGARFTLLFPRVDRSAESPHDAGGRSSLKGGTERILLVEDEKAVRRFIASTLCTRGYSVHETCNGTEALEYLANAAGSVDLVITDVVMPKMGGGELAVKIRAAHPRMKVLFITGYVGEEFSPPEREENLHLRKPFTVDDLVAKVRQVLDAE
jgi:two-component system cell cycle sensor histidine kinase/response regulator CckA